MIALVKNPEEETWKGYLYAVVLTVTAIAQTIFMNHYMQYMNSVGLKVRTVIVASVYRKVSSFDNQISQADIFLISYPTGTSYFQ